MMKEVVEQYDVVVCGGGLAGFCAAVASARQGAKTCIIQDRPVFGGNSSSEVRVTVHGSAAFHAYARETGILSELLIEERAQNHQSINENGWTNRTWDMVMYDMARNTENLSYHLNTALCDVIMDDGTRGSKSHDTFLSPKEAAATGYYHRKAQVEGGRIQAIDAIILDSECRLRIESNIFIDCTGDATLSHLAGAEWRMGSEGRDEFNEPHAPENPSTDTMGNSLNIYLKDVGRPAPFTPPSWAKELRDPDFFYEQGRNPDEQEGGFWWIEIGVPWHTLHDGEAIREELVAYAYGVWDWMKNHDEKIKHKFENYVLESVTQVLGKRESRRVMGKYLFNEHDPINKTVFKDEIAFGGWFIDLHTPGGLLAPTSEPASAEGYQRDSEYAAKSYCGPYGIPLSACISKDVNNLMMAGRCLSSTRAALGTARVMGTTAIMGQGCGVAAATAVKSDLEIGDLPDHETLMPRVQQQLLLDGCFLPNVSHQDKTDLSKQAKASASSEAMSYGLGPQSSSVHTGVERYFYKSEDEMAGQCNLDRMMAQLIATRGAHLDQVSVCLSNRSGAVAKVPAKLWVVSSIWDYRKEAEILLAESELELPIGEYQWVDWSVNLTDEQGLPDHAWLRLDLGEAKDVIWWPAQDAVEPGHNAFTHISAKKFRRMGRSHTMCFKVEPPQPVYPAQEVLSGEARPQHSTNLWRSEPNCPLPQWWACEWEEEQSFSEVRLVFPGHILWEYHGYEPFYRDPQMAKDYEIQVKEADQWVTVSKVKDNYQRLNVVKLDSPVSTKAMRVLIQSTWGDPSAAIYECRVYT